LPPSQPNPNIILTSAGLSPTDVTYGNSADDLLYLEWLYAAGLKGGVNYDVLGANGNTHAPCADCPFNSLPAFPHPSFYVRRVEQLREAQVANAMEIVRSGCSSSAGPMIRSTQRIPGSPSAKTRKSRTLSPPINTRGRPGSRGSESWRCGPFQIPPGLQIVKSTGGRLRTPAGRRDQRTGPSRRHERLAN
jgi:hypothetical protein